MTDRADDALLPAFSFITVDVEGRPDLIAIRCRSCGASYAARTRYACARCHARGDDAFEAFSPCREGKLHAATIVHRAYPGIAVPFISAVVDLDNGPTLKGMLRAENFEPEAIRPGRRVRVIFDEALGRTDKDGHHYVSHFFVPA